MRTPSAQETAASPYSFGGMILDALVSEPEQCAFRYNGETLSRGDLRDQAKAIAARLHEHGHQPGEAVAIEVEHSLELPIAMCGAQVAGACAVPIDPALSKARRAAILKDIGPKFILTRSLGSDNNIKIEHRNAAVDKSELLDRDLAFVVYTSGSSGGPKGVMISQESYVRRMQNILPSYVPLVDDVDLTWTPSSFTVMVDEIFLPILAGVRSIIASPALRMDPFAFAALVISEQITSFRVTPSVLDLLLRKATSQALSGVRTIICSGEALPADLQARAHDLLPATLIGFYGATEAPAVAAIYFDRSATPNDATICTPQPFVPILIMNEAGKRLPTGQAGEIWVGGIAVARGYFNLPELTAERFVFLDGERWYRTGDLGQFLPNGQLELLGRVDLSEVKVNGTRVNLPEVTAALRAHPDLAAAWVCGVEQKGHRDPILVAQCVPCDANSFDVNAIRSSLMRALPSPAIPSNFYALKALPLTDNGKVDARRLQEMAKAFLDERGQHIVAAAKPTRVVTSHHDNWQSILPLVLNSAEKLLGTSNLSEEANFFAVGGDSLKAVHLALDLAEQINRDVKPTLVTNTESFKELSQAIASPQNSNTFAARLIKSGTDEDVPIFTINDRRRYEILAPQLTARFSIWNLDLFGLAEQELSGFDSFTLQEVAGFFADAVLAVRSSGPWCFIGFCQSSCLAIELARTLKERTGETGALFLIDAFFTEFLPTPRVHFGRLLDFGPTYFFQKAFRRLGLTSHDSGLEDVPIGVRDELLEQSKGQRVVVKQRFWDLYETYSVEPYDGPVSLFASNEFRHNSRVGAQRLAAKGLSVSIVEGMHTQLFQPKNSNQSLARSIDAELIKLASINARFA